MHKVFIDLLIVIWIAASTLNIAAIINPQFAVLLYPAVSVILLVGFTIRSIIE